MSSRKKPASNARARSGSVLAIHGGAGVIERASMTGDTEQAYRTGLELALRAGHAVLADGGGSMDAVVTAVAVMEDSPLFNAGKVAAFTSEGRNELDAAVTDKHGTVGAVALDAHGNLAAATSTGGRSNKLGGRIGDSPVIGAGTYANNATAAVSCTGEGEYFMRSVAAHTVSALMEHKGWSARRAAEHVMHQRLGALGGKGGMIALDAKGNLAMPFSSTGLYRGHIGVDGEAVVKIYQDD